MIRWRLVQKDHRQSDIESKGSDPWTKSVGILSTRTLHYFYNNNNNNVENLVFYIKMKNT